MYFMKQFVKAMKLNQISGFVGFCLGLTDTSMIFSVCRRAKKKKRRKNTNVKKKRRTFLGVRWMNLWSNQKKQVKWQHHPLPPLQRYVTVTVQYLLSPIIQIA